MGHGFFLPKRLSLLGIQALFRGLALDRVEVFDQKQHWSRPFRIQLTGVRYITPSVIPTPGSAHAGAAHESVMPAIGISLNRSLEALGHEG